MPRLRSSFPAPTASDIAALFEQTKRWGRWGVDDERGALNFLTPVVVAAAVTSVRHGETVGCGLPLSTATEIDNPSPAEHRMIADGHTNAMTTSAGLQCSLDFMGVACHGMSVTHLDAFCHVFVDGLMWNGRPASEVGAHGATVNDVRASTDGIVGRGVLLDLPRWLGRAWLEPDEVITPDELSACAAAQEVDVRRGDIVLVSTGREARRESIGPWNPSDSGLAGLHHDCVRWVHDHEISVLGCDGVSDPLPGVRNGGWPMPLHQCCLVGMGVHLLDNLALRRLSKRCAALSQWTFLFCTGPLHLAGATGSAVNPTAVL